MKRFVGYLIDKGIKSLPRKKKVSPDIKSVKPTKDIKGSVERVKTEEFRKRYKAVDKAEDKMKTGKKMMREGQKERKKLIDTGRAVQFKHTKTVSAIKPGEKDRFKGLTTEEKPKKFKKGKELDRENKMGGGMMGRRMGYSQGSNGKIKFDAKKSDLDKSGSLSPYEKRRGMAIAKAMAKRKKKA
jgi:ribosomal protein L14E/L6E/L27E